MQMLLSYHSRQMHDANAKTSCRARVGHSPAAITENGSPKTPVPTMEFTRIDSAVQGPYCFGGGGGSSPNSERAELLRLRSASCSAADPASDPPLIVRRGMGPIPRKEKIGEPEEC